MNKETRVAPYRSLRSLQLDYASLVHTHIFAPLSVSTIDRCAVSSADWKLLKTDSFTSVGMKDRLDQDLRTREDLNPEKMKVSEARRCNCVRMDETIVIDLHHILRFLCKSAMFCVLRFCITFACCAFAQRCARLRK